MNSSISTDCEGPRPRVAKKECRRPRSSRRRSRCFLNQYEGPRTQALQNKKERSCEPEKVGMVGSWGLEPQTSTVSIQSREMQRHARPCHSVCQRESVIGPLAFAELRANRQSEPGNGDAQHAPIAISLTTSKLRMSWNRGSLRIFINAAKPENKGATIKRIRILRLTSIVLSKGGCILPGLYHSRELTRFVQ